MQVRRWKHMSGHSRACNEPSTEAHQISASGTAKADNSVGLQFINASHPRDVISIEAKKRIRSHAAKDVHASRHRQGARRRQFVVQAEGVGAHFAAPLPAPASLLSSSRKDPFQSLARPVTEREHFLIDHYVTVVIPNAHSYCNHGDAEALFLVGMKLHWLPMALSDVGLLCGLLLAACRHLTAPSPVASDDYTQMALRYKGVCIKSTNEAVVAEGTSVSDTTIAKALIMSSDEFSSHGPVSLTKLRHKFLCGNLEVSRVHADAIIRMVALKGGLGNLGVGGFLRHLVSWCVFNPKFGERASILLEEYM
ncbi:hypothetical protein B0T10DRAFT_546022 [Thelonectria olida]|uniref:Uncharacterized protein n=1 Tax=Thelonectria olida TaxID=1576542 RepID=A0A9P8WBK3_9HYPO|nr:hypothetical protein B0T10DRAFT_546022 [Thelonectria olida]